MAEKECDNCGDKTERKYLGKIRGKNLCKKCRTKVRNKRREETIDKAGIKDELKSLDRKIRNDWQRKNYRKKNPFKEKKIINEIPIPKGTTRGKVKQKNKSESYLGFKESQVMLKIIMGRGMDFEDAKEELKRIKEELKITREKMKEQNKPEKEIKLKEQQMLEEMYKY